MPIVDSRNGVPIRLTEERWQHVLYRHPEMRDQRERVLETLTRTADSLAPAAELSQLGIIQWGGPTVYELAYASGIFVRLVEITFMAERTAAGVVFGPNDAEPLPGITALDSVGITLDPGSQTLKRLSAIPLRYFNFAWVIQKGYLSMEKPDPPTLQDSSKPRDSELSDQEKEALLEQVEQFEGPDRREIRGEEPETSENTGVSPS